jgi:hypothetical protein
MNVVKIAANKTLHMRRNLADIPIPPPPVDQRAQSKKVVGTKPGTSI